MPAAGATLFSPTTLIGQTVIATPSPGQQSETGPADYILRIAASPVEIAPKHIVSTITYNGQFPGPLLRFKEGQSANDRSAQRHGLLPSSCIGMAKWFPLTSMALPKKGTPFIPAHGMRRIVFTPRPSGFRFYHTHNRAGADLHAGQYSGQVGPVYIEPKHEPGSYDREVFLVLKEFEPSFSQGGDMAQDFLSPSHASQRTGNVWRVRDESLTREGDAARL